MATVQRRQFFAGGGLTEVGHFVSLASSATLCAAHLALLHSDTDAGLVDLSEQVMDFLTTATRHSLTFTVVAFFTHMLSFSANKCRPTLPDLLFPVFCAVNIFSFFLNQKTHREDLVLLRAALSSFMFILSTAVTFAPRKLLHRKKPNPIIASAFSVASTPASQWSRNESAFLMNSFNGKDNKLSPPARNYLWQYRDQKAEDSPVTPHQQRALRRLGLETEEMEWDSVDSPKHDSPAQRSVFAKENTPSREIASSLSGMSLSGIGRSRSMFQSPMLTSKSPSVAGSAFDDRFNRGFLNSAGTASTMSTGSFMRPSSVFTTDSTPMLRNRIRPLSQPRGPASVMSGMTSISRRPPLILEESDSPANSNGSDFTSISQRTVPVESVNKMLIYSCITLALVTLIACSTIGYLMGKVGMLH